MLSTGVSVQSARAQTYQVLYRFSGRDGASPYGGLLRDAAGNLYGTAIYGGPNDCIGFGCGVAFKINTTGKETVLYNFQQQTSGFAPNAGLIRDSAGSFYGTAIFGGDQNCDAPYGCGTVFRLDTSGNETVLHAFNGQDGGDPQATLIRDPAGNFYGTTAGGGSAKNGTVFKLDTEGNETLLHSFTGKTDGGTALGALIRDTQGNLYGTTEFGGDLKGACGTLGCGVAYKIHPGGGETVLYTFTGGTDGAEPVGSLLFDSAGDLYGTTSFGGDLTCNAPSGCGVIFKLDRAGVETVIYAFTGEPTDGQEPIDGLVRDAAGNLYGTTYRGGAYGVGTIFKLDTSGNESVLYSFTGGTDGSFPYAGLILDPAGNLYGTAISGGKSGCLVDEGCGVVFKVTP